MQTFDRILGEIKGRIPQISITGHGEPLLHPKLPEMVEKAVNEGFHVSVLTNCTLLTPELGRRLIDAGLNRIVLSHEGSTPQLHEAIRVNSNYAVTERNTLEFLKLNESLGHSVFVCLSMVDSKAAAADAAAFTKRYEAMPVDTVFVSRQLNFFGLVPTEDDEEILRGNADSGGRCAACHVPWLGFSINWDGSVQACPIDYNGEASFSGNLLHDSLDEVWNGHTIQEFRRCLLERDFSSFPETLCSGCNVLHWPEQSLSEGKALAISKLARFAEVFAVQAPGRRNVSMEKIEAVDRELEKLGAQADSSVERRV